MSVIRIGQGYYGIDTQGVNASRNASSNVEEAFEWANGIPADKLNVRLASEKKTRSTTSLENADEAPESEEASS